MQAANQGRSYQHQGSSYALNKVMAIDVVFKDFLWYYTGVFAIVYASEAKKSVFLVHLDCFSKYLKYLKKI